MGFYSNRRFNKKGITEVISFVLVTLLIVIASISAYVFSKYTLEKDRDNLDYNKMIKDLNSFREVINQISSFQDAQTSYEFSFKSGQLQFKGNQVSYISMRDNDGTFSYCEKDICFRGFNNTEWVYYNLSNSYVFSCNFTLVPGDYLLTFKNIKNESQIEISLVE